MRLPHPNAERHLLPSGAAFNEYRMHYQEHARITAAQKKMETLPTIVAKFQAMADEHRADCEAILTEHNHAKN